jgi:hypothetical protein
MNLLCLSIFIQHKEANRKTSLKKKEKEEEEENSVVI